MQDLQISGQVEKPGAKGMETHVEVSLSSMGEIPSIANSPDAKVHLFLLQRAHHEY